MDEEEDYEMEYHKENDEMDNYNEVGTVVGCSSSRSGLVYDYDETHTHVDDGNFDGRTDDCSPLLLFILLALAVFSDLLLEIK